MKPAVLFDVDGTLVRGKGAGRHALSLALAGILGVPQERAWDATGRVDYRGSTDRRILEQIFGFLDAPADLRQETVIEAYLGHLPETMKACEMALLPGAVEVVARLASMNVRVGLLTGNVRAAARLKIAPFGLAHLADVPGGFGDDARDRVEIARVARERLVADGGPAQPLVVVGDTEWDVVAAREIGAVAVAVLTGWTDREHLEAAGPDVILGDLSDPAPLFDLMGGAPS